MGFEQFDKTPAQGTTSSSIPKLSVRKSDSIGLNKSAMVEFFDTSVEGIVLHYDSDNDIIGIEPVEELEENPNAYSLSRRHENGGGTVSAMAFLREYGLRHDATSHYQAEWNEQHEMVVSDLSKEITTYGVSDTIEATDSPIEAGDSSTPETSTTRSDLRTSD